MDVRAAAAGVRELGGGQRGQDAGGGRGGRAGGEEAAVSPRQARRRQDRVGQDAGQQVVRLDTEQRPTGQEWRKSGEATFAHEIPSNGLHRPIHEYRHRDLIPSLLQYDCECI